MYSVLYFIIGAIIGSFINMLASRLVSDKPLITYRSKCNNCSTSIAWYDLIPVLSYIWLRGKCRNCKTQIPIYFPVIEVFFGLIILILFTYEPLSMITVLKLLCLGLLTVCSITDALSYHVYNKVLYPMIAVVITLWFVSGANLYMIAQALILLAFIFVLASIVRLIKKEKTIGDGDYFIFFCIGLLFAYEDIISIILFSSVAGIILSIIFRKKALPFIPLLQLGIMATYVWR